MVLNAQKITVTEFDEWVHLPENIETHYEFIGGDIVQVVSNSKSSNLGMFIGSFITMYVHTNKLGHTTGADGGYQVGDERYIPDTGFISKERMPELESASYISVAPDLALEVVSPSDSQRLLMIKIGNYLAEQTTVWVVYPEEQEIEIYAPNTSVIKLTKDDTLEGGGVLPGFQLPLKTIFE